MKIGYTDAVRVSDRKRALKWGIPTTDLIMQPTSTNMTQFSQYMFELWAEVKEQSKTITKLKPEKKSICS